MTNDEELDQKNRAVIQQAWAELNPLNGINPSHPKSLIDLLNDLFVNCIDKSPDVFLVKCKELGTLTRCRAGHFESASDILPPPLKIAEDKNIVNRWNPPGKRFLYTAHSYNNSPIGELTENEYTCFQEMRATKGGAYTFAEFSVNPGSEYKCFINMDYTGLYQRDIDIYRDNLLRSQVQIISSTLLNSGVFLSKSQLEPIIKPRTRKIASEYLGMSFLRPICQTIFTPIDDDKCCTGVEREKAYKSFHILAEYLETKNIAGVIYPSTRTALNGFHTQNVVAFHVDDFSVISSSLRTLVY